MTFFRWKKKRNEMRVFGAFFAWKEDSNVFFLEVEQFAPRNIRKTSLSYWLSVTFLTSGGYKFGVK